MAYEHKDSMSPRGMAAYWTLVSKLLRQRSNNRPSNQMQMQIDELIGQTLRSCQTYNYRDLATIAISLAKIINKVGKSHRRQHKGSTEQILQDVLIGRESKNKQVIFNYIASVSVAILHEFDARHLSNLIYAFGLAEEVVLVENGSTYFDMLAEEVLSFDSFDEFNSYDLSNMLWALANVKDEQPKLFKKIGDHIVGLDNLNSFNGQDCSITVWAYATANETHPRLFEKVADHIATLDNLHNFKPQALSNTVWACATAKEQHSQLFKKIADHIVELVGLDNLKSFNGQDCSNTLWAFATAGESHPQLFKRLGDHIAGLDSLRHFNEQELSNTVWSYATAGESQPQLFKRVADHIVTLDSLDRYDSQALSNISWAYATAEESNPQLFNKLAEEAIKRQHEFTSQGIANFLWAYASNGQVDKHLFSSLVTSIKANLDKYNAQDLANVAWAYSVADVNVPSEFNNEFINSCLNKEDEFILEALRQLHQWQLWQDELKSDISLPSSLQKRCYEAFISRIPEPSKFQDDVISSLSSMGLQPQEEVLLKSGYQIDAVVEVNGKQVAVEVDGPSHFIGRELTGSTILKHRQVAIVDGIRVVSVPYWEWNKLKKGKKEQYLRSSLGNIK